MTTTYSAKSAAIRAARSALGPEAIPGADFHVTEAEGRWAWSEGAAPTLAQTVHVVPLGTEIRFTAKAKAELEAREKATRMSAKHRAALEAAQRGELPTPPDFSAETHKRWRPKLAAVVALAQAGDVAGLRAFEINPVSTSPKAIARYRDLAIVALEARRAH